MAEQIPYAQQDLSGALQVGTSHLLRRKNEVASSKNAAFNVLVGSAVRRPGYEKVATTIEQGNDSLYGGVFRSFGGFKVITGINNATNTAGTLRVMDTGDYWTTILNTAPPSCRFNCLNDNDQFYVAGAAPNGSYLPLTNIDSTLTPSTTRNVYGAPASKFIAEYGGELYAVNCYLNGKAYPDRFYKSSPLLGAITFVQTDQGGILNQLRVDDVRYLKVGMSIDAYSGGTEAKVGTVVVTYVDKKNNRIGFNPTNFIVKDNDELWLTGTKGTLSRFWNTDYKTPETADWEKVPPGKEANPEFTGHGNNSNRMLLFTRNSSMMWDGGQFIDISKTVGCVSHETIQNIGSWTLWLHTTGVWGYNVVTGQFKRLSKPVGSYIKAVNQSNLSKASAVVVDGAVYKLSVGELLPLGSDTTSTSTSSTSTSSTSSSTSSTSTSSTSTSSTSSSTSQSTTSTSSTSSSTTSSSTSSTTSSTSTTSSSTSTSSTSTSTIVSTKKVCRLVYDFDLNAWWPEEHRREQRFQFNHTMNGYTKPYFTDETGRLFRDETGWTDAGDSIPMEVEWGRNNFGIDQAKVYNSVLVDSEDAEGGKLRYSIDGKQFNTMPTQITDLVTLITFGQRGQLIEGRDINYKFSHNDKGAPPIINGLTNFFAVTEMNPNEASRV